jgi:hypothetical protein
MNGVSINTSLLDHTKVDVFKFLRKRSAFIPNWPIAPELALGLIRLYWC